MSDFHGMSCAHCQDVARADTILSDIAKAIENAHPEQRERFRDAVSAVLNQPIATLKMSDGTKKTIMLDPLGAADESPFRVVDREV